MLAIAGLARNPSEGGSSGQDSELMPRENMPRPAKGQQCETHRSIVQKAQKSRTASADEKILLKVQLMGSLRGPSRSSSGMSETGEREIAKPDYLRLFLPSIPGSPHSPPA